MTGKHWSFLRSNELNKPVNLLQYLPLIIKMISPIDFSHSNIISVFNEEGEMVFQQEGLGVSYDKTISVVNEEASN